MANWLYFRIIINSVIYLTKMIKHFKLDLYPVELYVGISNDITSILSDFANIDGSDEVLKDSWQPTHMAYTYYDIYNKHSKYQSVIILFREDVEIKLHTIVHEISHACKHIWNYIGEVNPSHEADAYLAEYIMKCIVDTLDIKITSTNIKPINFDETEALKRYSDVFHPIGIKLVPPPSKL